MSTLKVNKIEQTGTTDGGIQLDSDGHVQIDGIQLPTSGALSNRNLIINGAMRVAQRGTSTTTGPNGTGEGYTTLDRWSTALNHGTAATTFSQSTDAPSGFGYSLKYEVTTAQSTLTASDFWLLSHKLEGQDLQSIGKGTSDAKQLTLSFWVKATKTGTNNVELTDNDNSRLTTKQFTVNTSNTWEHKTIVFDADTTGAFDNDNALSLQVEWWISAGTNWTSGSVTSWASEVAANRAPSQVNNLDTVGNVFQITGVQLEVGSVATPFEHRSFGDELNRCKRYFSILSPGFEAIRGATGTVYSTANLQSFMQLPPMRVMPTLSDPDGNTTVVMSGRTSTFTVSSNWNLLPFGVNNQPDNMLVGFSYNSANNGGTNLPTSEAFLVLTEAVHASAEL